MSAEHSTSMMEDPHVWAALAFVVLVALAWRKLSAFAKGALDSRTGRIKSELGAAEKLREEAQELLLTYKRRQAHYLKEAEQIIAQAREDAAELAKTAEAELKASLESRLKMTTAKIATAEAKAVADVRAQAIDAAINAARTQLAGQAQSQSPERAFQGSLEDIKRAIG